MFVSSALVRTVRKEAVKSGDILICPPREETRRDARGTPNVSEHCRSSRRRQPSSSGGNRKSSGRVGKRKSQQSDGSPSDELSDGSPSDELSEKRRRGRPEGCGYNASYSTEGYRSHTIPLGKFKRANFNNPDTAREVATHVVEDMTERFNLGLVIPPDAPFSYNG